MSRYKFKYTHCNLGKHKCNGCKREYDKIWTPIYRKNPNVIKLKNLDARRYSKKIKLIIFSHYSIKDIKCAIHHIHFPKEKEITDLRCLSINHINGNGHLHRKKVGNGTHFYLWLIKHNFPDGYNIICMNCQFKDAKIRNGIEDKTKQLLKNNLKIKVICHYSNNNMTCKKCGQDDNDVLTINHKEGNGKKHLQSLKLHGGNLFYRWLIKNNYPEEYNILCMNCQFIDRDKRLYNK